MCIVCFFFICFASSTFCLVDKLGTCVVVTVYNLADGKGVIIGDSVAIPEPYVTDIDFKYKNNVSDLYITNNFMWCEEMFANIYFLTVSALQI